MTDSPVGESLTRMKWEEKEIKSTIVMESGRFVRDNLGAEVQRRVAARECEKIPGRVLDKTGDNEE